LAFLSCYHLRWILTEVGHRIGHSFRAKANRLGRPRIIVSTAGLSSSARWPMDTLTFSFGKSAARCTPWPSSCSMSIWAAS